MACCGSLFGRSHQRLRPSSCCRLPLATALLIILLLFLTVFTQPSSCRPMPSAHLDSNIIALPTAETMAARREEENELAGKVMRLLDVKPRGRAPPSAPSKRTNDINT